jgi:hypothetical protein
MKLRRRPELTFRSTSRKEMRTTTGIGPTADGKSTANSESESGPLPSSSHSPVCV